MMIEAIDMALDDCVAVLLQGAVIDMAESTADVHASVRLRHIAICLDNVPPSVGVLDREGEELLAAAALRFAGKTVNTAHRDSLLRVVRQLSDGK